MLLLLVLLVLLAYPFVVIDHKLNNLMLPARRSRSNLQLRSHTLPYMWAHTWSHPGKHIERSPSSDRRSGLRTNQPPSPRFALPSRRSNPRCISPHSTSPLLSHRASLVSAPQDILIQVPRHPTTAPHTAHHTTALRKISDIRALSTSPAHTPVTIQTRANKLSIGG